MLFTNREELGVYPRLWNGTPQVFWNCIKKNEDYLSANIENYNLWNIASCDIDVTNSVVAAPLSAEHCVYTFISLWLWLLLKIS